MGSVEERLQQITPILQEPATKEAAISLDESKMPVVAKVVNEACVSSNSFNSNAYVTGSKENLSVLNSNAWTLMGLWLPML